jgi:hypothetical protein
MGVYSGSEFSSDQDSEEGQNYSPEAYNKLPNFFVEDESEPDRTNGSDSRTSPTNKPLILHEKSNGSLPHKQAIDLTEPGSFVKQEGTKVDNQQDKTQNNEDASLDLGTKFAEFSQDRLEKERD